MPSRPSTRSTRRPLFLTKLEGRTAPAVATWDGGGANSNWSTPANWAGDTVPQAGDDLVFPAGPAQTTSVNDLAADTAFRSIGVTGGSYQISGNAVSVTDGVTTDVAAGGSSTLSLVIGGTGGLTKAGAGTLVLFGANSYAGPSAVTAGILEVRSDTALGAIGAGNETTVTDGATVELHGKDDASFQGLSVAEPIFFSGRGAGGIGAITNRFPDNTLSGALTLTGDALITGRFGAVRIAGGIGEVGGPHNLEIRAIGSAEKVAVFTPTAVNTYTGTTAVFGAASSDGSGYGTVQFDGHGVSPMVIRGTIEGTGAVGPIRTVDNLSYIMPGGFRVPGTLTMGGLDFETGILRLDVRADGVDRLDVNGPVTLGGGSVFYFDNQFVPTPGARYTLIANDGTDPVQGTFAAQPEGAIVANVGDSAVRLSYHGGDGNDVDLYTEPAESLRRYAVGAGPGGEPRVNVYDATGALVRSFLAYDAGFRGGVHVASCDVTGDGVPDVITGPGFGGGPHVRIFDGETGNLLSQFLAFEPSFRGGVNVASAFLTTDSFADIIVGAGATGGPRVKVYDGRNGIILSDFFAYDPSFRGGVSVAGHGWSHQLVAGTDQSFSGGVITGPGPGGGPHVRFFAAVGSFGYIPDGFGFMAYDAAFRGGINVAIASHPGRLNHPLNPPDPIVVAPISGMGPYVRIFDNVDLTQFREFAAYAPNFRGGVTVAVVPIERTGLGVLITGAGPGGGPHVIERESFYELSVRHSFLAFDPSFSGGLFVG